MDYKKLVFEIKDVVENTPALSNHSHDIDEMQEIDEMFDKLWELLKDVEP